jgi:hypothetical protein
MNNKPDIVSQTPDKRNENAESIQDCSSCKWRTVINGMRHCEAGVVGAFRRGDEGCTYERKSGPSCETCRHGDFRGPITGGVFYYCNALLAGIYPDDAAQKYGCPSYVSKEPPVVKLSEKLLELKKQIDLANEEAYTDDVDLFGMSIDCEDAANEALSLETALDEMPSMERDLRSFEKLAKECGWLEIHSRPAVLFVRDVLDASLNTLEWIAQQPCTQDAEGASEDCDCIETGACITEYCLPCYARNALRDIRANANQTLESTLDALTKANARAEKAEAELKRVLPDPRAGWEKPDNYESEDLSIRDGAYIYHPKEPFNPQFSSPKVEGNND